MHKHISHYDRPVLPWQDNLVRCFNLLHFPYTTVKEIYFLQVIKPRVCVKPARTLVVGQLNPNNIVANLEEDVTLPLIEMAGTEGYTALSTRFKTTDLASELRCAQIQHTEMPFDPVQHTSHIPDIIYPSPVSMNSTTLTYAT